MHDLVPLLTIVAMLISAVMICAGAGVVLMRSDPMEVSWRALTGWSLLAAAAVLATAAVRYAGTDTAPPFEVGIFALLMCVPVARVLWPRQQRLACLGMLDPPAADLRLASAGAGTHGLQAGRPHVARMPGRSRTFRDAA